MTDHADISRRLALAIGWKGTDFDSADGVLYVCIAPATFNEFAKFRRFDYRDPAVIWPVAERFSAFPEKALGSSHWYVERWEPIYQFTQSDTAALAVAMAVIKAKDSK